MEVTLNPSGFSGTVHIPSSKSHSIRALLIASFSKSVCRIENLLMCDDVKTCIEVCRKLGVVIATSDIGTISVTTVDGTGLAENGSFELDCGNSGTVLFFATALCATLDINAVLKGDSSLEKRSALNLIESLKQLGAEIDGNGFVPYSVQGKIKGGETKIDCPTSQYLSALLLACPLAEHDSLIKVGLLNEKPYISMTVSWLKEQGIKYIYNRDENSFLVYGRQQYRSFNATIGGDWSSAAFFFVAAAVTGGVVCITGLNREDSQGDRRILEILEKMGCLVTYEKDGITLRGPEKLKAIKADLNAIPDLFPVLAVAGCFADGEVTLFNVAQARLKETDRISVMANNLNAIGADITELEDGLLIRPISGLKGGRVNSFNDHRVAMAMAVSSLKCASSLTIVNAEVVGVSYPDFYSVFEKLTERRTV